jgi:hypothetical protein
VEVFDHGDADVCVEGVAGEAVAAEAEVGRDGAGGDADNGASGAGEVEVRGDLAEEGLGDLGAVVGREEVGAEDFEAAAGDGGARVEAVEMRDVGAGWVEQRHVLARVCAVGRRCKCPARTARGFAWSGKIVVGTSLEEVMVEVAEE